MTTPTISMDQLVLGLQPVHQQSVILQASQHQIAQQQLDQAQDAPPKAATSKRGARAGGSSVLEPLPDDGGPASSFAALASASLASFSLASASLAAAFSAATLAFAVSILLKLFPLLRVERRAA